MSRLNPSHEYIIARWVREGLKSPPVFVFPSFLIDRISAKPVIKFLVNGLELTVIICNYFGKFEFYSDKNKILCKKVLSGT